MNTKFLLSIIRSIIFLLFDGATVKVTFLKNSEVVSNILVSRFETSHNLMHMALSCGKCGFLRVQDPNSLAISDLRNQIGLKPADFDDIELRYLDQGQKYCKWVDFIV